MAILVLSTFVVLFTERPDAGVISARFMDSYDPVAPDAVAVPLPALVDDSAQDADSPGDAVATGDVVEGECCGGSAAFQGLSVSGTRIAEPTSLLLLGLGLAVLAWSIKRKRRK
jgi:PEP-CTERM motif-containing protein